MLGWLLLGESGGLCGSPKGLKKILKHVASKIEDMPIGFVIVLIFLLLVIAFAYGACPFPAGSILPPAGPPVN